MSAKATKKKLPAKKFLKQHSNFSRANLLFVVAIFGLIGGYLLFKSFAATIYYISASGSDSNACTQTAPCATFQRAYQLAQGGDTIAVAGGAYSADYPNEGALKLRPDSSKSATPVTFVCGDGQPVTFKAGADQFVITAQHVVMRGSCFKFNRLWVGDPANGVSTQDVTIDGVSMMMFDISGSDGVTIQNSIVGPDVACYAPGQAASCQNNAATNESYFALNGRSNTEYHEPKIHYGGPGGAVNPTNIKILNNTFSQLQTRDSSNLHTGCLWIGYGNQGGPTLIQGNKFSGCAVYDTHVDVPSTWNLTFDSNTYGYPVEPVQTGNSFSTEAPTSETDIQVKCQTGQLLTNYALTNNTFAHGWDLDFGGCSGNTYSNLNVSGNIGGAIQNPGQTGGPPPPSAPSVSLSASPSTISSGGTSNLSWNSANATACSASGGWSGTKATSGTEVTGALTASATYMLTCTGAGGSSTASATVIVNAQTGDTTPPKISITNPTNSATVSAGVTVLASASDNVAVSKVDFFADGKPISTTTASPYESLHWDTTKATNGTHTLSAAATDTSGNSSTTSISVTVSNTTSPPPTNPTDTQPPTAPPNFKVTGTGKTSISLSWGASTDNVGVVGYRLYRNNIALVSRTSLKYTDSGLSSGSAYNYYVVAYDKAGNVSAASQKVCVQKYSFWSFFSRNRSWSYC